MKQLRWFFCVSLCLLGMMTMGVSKADNMPALRRGINMSSWLANAKRQTFFNRDFQQIKKVGFDNVRLPFNPSYFGFRLEPGSPGVKAVNFSPLDQALHMALQNHLDVAINVHSSTAVMNTLENNPDWAEKEFIDLWVNMARRYKDYPSGVVYELMNEPHYYKKEDQYANFVRKLVAAIRTVDKKHLIIVSGPDGSSINGLLKVQPISDPHIAYDFHFYEPYIITHQGVHRGFEGTMIRYFRNVPYPSSNVKNSAQAYTEKAPDTGLAQKELEEYTNTPWNAVHIAQRLKIAKDWAASKRVRIICSEFGVLRNHIDPASRYRWIEDMRKTLEADGIGWQIWEYADLDGITVPIGETKTDPVDGSVWLTHPEKGSRVYEPLALKALGLHTKSVK